MSRYTPEPLITLPPPAAHVHLVEHLDLLAVDHNGVRGVLHGALEAAVLHNVEMWVQGGRNVEMWDREGSGALGRGNKGTRAGSVAAVDRVLASFL